MDFEIDHLVVTAETLEEGVAEVEARLGVTMAPGGAHPFMGTHNKLLSIGPGLYLEVIAVDPAATAPGHARWFALDDFAGPPRLSHWVARGSDLDGALARAPAGAGRAMAAARGALSWRIAVPEDGRLPYEGMFLGLIEWDGTAHPADALADSGCRLEMLELVHPRPAELRGVLDPIVTDARVVVREGPVAQLRAHLETPRGPRVLA